MSKTYTVDYPIRHGHIENWDQMERFWQKSVFKYLRAEPEDHFFLLVSSRVPRAVAIWRVASSLCVISTIRSDVVNP